MIRTIKRWLSLVLPYTPMAGGKRVLDAEYSSGAWDYLRGLDEFARFSVVAGYVHFLRPGGSVLEIGCGEGILQERLDDAKYSFYLGLDVSSEAIARAAVKNDAQRTFLVADAETFTPDRRFDAIVFNEVLEYFDDPAALVRRYESALAPNGMFIVSMFAGLDTARTKRIWKRLEERHQPYSATRISNDKGYTWVVKVFVPSAAPAR